MKLTTEQIDQLYAFTIKHYVEYYDLQTELVDHLANAIEQQWQENPKLSFDEALNVEFKKFGIFGFSDLVERRKKALENKYRKIVLSHLLEFFKIPRIILTALLTVLVFFILKSDFFEAVVSFFSEFGQIIFIPVVIIAQYKWNMRIKKDEKRWMFKEMINTYGYALVLTPFVLNLVFKLIFKFSPDTFVNVTALVGVSVFMVLYGLITYIAMKVIPSKAEEYLKETYPEYELSK